jgi:hypothetical protein
MPGLERLARELEDVAFLYVDVGIVKYLRLFIYLHSDVLQYCSTFKQTDTSLIKFSIIKEHELFNFPSWTRKVKILSLFLYLARGVKESRLRRPQNCVAFRSVNAKNYSIIPSIYLGHIKTICVPSKTCNNWVIILLRNSMRKSSVFRKCLSHFFRQVPEITEQYSVAAFPTTFIFKVN